MSDAIVEAQRLYQDALDATTRQREQIAEDLRFSDPSEPDQWDHKIKSQRENDPGGARPCLVFDQTGQYVANVAGQVEQAPPAIHAIPVGNGADRKVAEQLDGFFRHIEHTSRAKQHYTRALTSAARTGVGYLIVRPDYVNRALNWQEPRISSEGDPLRVVLDPWSVEIDGSDADYGFLLTPYSHKAFERKFGKAEKVSFADEEKKQSVDDRESILVAESWRTDERTQNMIVCNDAMTGEEMALEEADYWQRMKDQPQSLVVAVDEYGQPRTYKDKCKVVKWGLMSGVAALEDEREYPASGIGIVPVYGYVGWSNGRMHYCGVPRRAMNAQRSYNYHMSEMHVFMGQAPKSPWIVPVRSVAGLEALWDRASVDSRAYLPYHDVDETGAAIAAPQRNQSSTNLQNHIAGAEQALHDIQASLGMYQASLGAPSNESSGVAIEARKQQGEAATAHFPSHLAAALGQVGKLCMEMIPRLIDTKRQLRILGIDETPGTVTIDPEQSDAMQETPQGLSINPNVGQYDVRVVVGASFSTQRAQAQTAYTEMMRANPALTPALAPLWAQTLDVPHADKLAQVLTAMAPDPVKAILSPEDKDKPNTAQLLQQVDQLKQALQEAIQHAQDAQQEADEAKDAAEDKDEESEAKLAELSIKKYEAETKRLQVLGAGEEQIKALVADLVAQMQAQPDPAGGMETPAMEEVEPEEEAGPSPELQQILQGHQQIAQSLQGLHEAVMRPRKRIPVRDEAGNISHVIDAPDNGSGSL